MTEQVAEVLEKHLGECGRFGRSCPNVSPRGEWCGRCDLRACVLADLEPLIAERERLARAEVANAYVRWGMKNEIAGVPLDWAWFGEIGRRYSPLHEHHESEETA